jgi:hypothetical protein
MTKLVTTNEIGRTQFTLAMKATLVKLTLGLTVAAMASSSFAQDDRDQRAIHDCSMMARKYSNTTEHIQRYYTWRACMGERGYMND